MIEELEIPKPLINGTDKKDVEHIPLCPYCGNKMLYRQARRGRNARNKVWRCSRYQNCMKIS